MRGTFTLLPAKNHVSKSAIFGHFLACLIKYGPIKLQRSAWSYVFLKIQFNTFPLQKTRAKFIENSPSNNFFRIMSAKCSSDLRPCPIYFLWSVFGRINTFFIRTSKFLLRLVILKFYHYVKLDCSWNVLIFSNCFLVIFSFSLWEKHCEARFVLNFS